jgi:hypothetical protein
MPTPRKYADNAQRQAAYRARRSWETGTVGTPPRRPGYRRWDAMMGQARTLLETITAEMDSYYEQRTEGWQNSERGESFTERLESIEEIVTLLRDPP